MTGNFLVSKLDNYIIFSASYQFIGPNQIRVKQDVILASKMQETKNDALKVTLKFINMGKHCQMLINGLDDTLKKMDGGAQQAPASKIEMNSKLLHIQMRAVDNNAQPAVTNSGTWKVDFHSLFH
jgi:hypothetical protein